LFGFQIFHRNLAAVVKNSIYTYDADATWLARQLSFVGVTAVK